MIHPQQLSEQELLELAALAEHFSTHPISLSIQAACRPAPDPARVTDVKEDVYKRQGQSTPCTSAWMGHFRNTL